MATMLEFEPTGSSELVGFAELPIVRIVHESDGIAAGVEFDEADAADRDIPKL